MCDLHSAKFSKRRNLENDCRPRGMDLKSAILAIWCHNPAKVHHTATSGSVFLFGFRGGGGGATTKRKRARAATAVVCKAAMRCEVGVIPAPRRGFTVSPRCLRWLLGSSAPSVPPSRRAPSLIIIPPSSSKQSPETRDAVATEPIVQNRRRSVLQHPLSVPFSPSLSITATPSSAPVLPPGPPRGSCSYRRAPLRFSTRA